MATSRLCFRSIIELNGINPYVLVSARRAVRIRKGWRKPLPVRVRVNGQPKKPWRINMVPAGDGSFYLYLHGDVRKASGTQVGDAVTVELEFDDEYRGGPAHPMPPWLRDALDGNRKARNAWSQLIPSRQKEILRYFSQLKSPEAQARNLERAMGVLSGSKARFMARSWNDDWMKLTVKLPDGCPMGAKCERRTIGEFQLLPRGAKPNHSLDLPESEVRLNADGALIIHASYTPANNVFSVIARFRSSTEDTHVVAAVAECSCVPVSLVCQLPTRQFVEIYLQREKDDN